MSQGVYVLGGKCPVGRGPGGKCPVGRGPVGKYPVGRGYVLEPACLYFYTKWIHPPDRVLS